MPLLSRNVYFLFLRKTHLKSQGFTPKWISEINIATSCQKRSVVRQNVSIIKWSQSKSRLLCTSVSSPGLREQCLISAWTVPQLPRERLLSSPELPWRLHLFPLLIKLISVSLMRRCSGFLLWMEREREMETTERMTERKNTTRPFVG